MVPFLFFFQGTNQTKAEKKNLAHSVWSQNPMLSDLQVSNGKGRQNYLCSTTPTYVKRGRVSLQRYSFCIGAYRENKSCHFSNLKVKIKNPALTFF